MIYLHSENENEKMIMYELYCILLMIYFYNSSRIRHKIPRIALPPRLLGWTYLYQNANESSFLDAAGFSREAFNLLVNSMVQCK